MKNSWICLFLLISGCANIPALPNVKTYSGCDPVYSTHEPPEVAKLQAVSDFVKENPNLFDRVFPATTAVQALATSAPGIGYGMAQIIQALKGDLTLGDIVTIGAIEGLKVLINARSEDKTQKRLDVCLPKDAKLLEFQRDDVKLRIEKGDYGRRTDSPNANNYPAAN